MTNLVGQEAREVKIKICVCDKPNDNTCGTSCRYLDCKGSILGWRCNLFHDDLFEDGKCYGYMAAKLIRNDFGIERCKQCLEGEN
jgi:hypothetical protein